VRAGVRGSEPREERAGALPRGGLRLADDIRGVAQELEQAAGLPGEGDPAFTEYYERYPLARGYTDKILLIDALIHSFHCDLTVNLPNRSSANNLIEGSHDQVVAFLDALAGRIRARRRSGEPCPPR
jgi:hypothetical protein